VDPTRLQSLQASREGLARLELTTKPCGSQPPSGRHSVAETGSGQRAGVPKNASEFAFLQCALLAFHAAAFVPLDHPPVVTYWGRPHEQYRHELQPARAGLVYEVKICRSATFTDQAIQDLRVGLDCHIHMFGAPVRI